MLRTVRAAFARVRALDRARGFARFVSSAGGVDDDDGGGGGGVDGGRSNDGLQYKVVTPPVPSWRTDDDAVTALQWLRKYLRHAPSGGDVYSYRRGERAGAAAHKLFRDRQVRRGLGSFEAYEPARNLKRAAKSRVLEPGEFLAVPDDRSTKGWYWATFRDEGELEDAAAEASLNVAFSEAIQKCVIYKDEHVLAINKPPGLATMPGQGVDVSVYDLRGALKFDAAEAPRLVHRLDRDTSGVLVLARTAFAANKLNALFRRKSKTDFTEILRAQLSSSGDPNVGDEDLTKTYWALSGAHPPRGLCEGWIDAPLLEGSDSSEDDSSRELVRLVGGWRVYDATAGGGSVIVGAGETSRANFREEEQMGSKAATTKFKVLASADEHGPTLLELTPVTGRKHQLRVHVSKALAAPILGDYKYGWSDRNKIWKSKLVSIEDAARKRHDDPDMQEPNESILGRAMRRTSNARGIPLHLHSRSLRFTHPETGASTTLVASPPEHFVAAMRAFDLRINDGNHT